MSGHSPLREDKTCLNCRHVVEKRYCPNCGQENTDSRKTFHHLFIHFFEDLTHYENAFWKTIRHLMFKPGRLTREYLSGKRLSYLAPVRLYIFISFVTFLIISFVSHGGETETGLDKPEHKKEAAAKETKPENDTIPAKPAGRSVSQERLARVDGKLVLVPEDSISPDVLEADSLKIGDINVRFTGRDTIRQSKSKSGYGNFKTLRELDSVQNALPEAKKYSWFRYTMEKFAVIMKEKSDEKDFTLRLSQEIIHNVPKALFLYMPIFAFWLWVFHGKKRWYYFDHGIFTLHYFSFMLLTLCLMIIINAISEWTGFEVLQAIVGFMWAMLCFWWFFYFFRSHSRFYGESKAISRLKSLGLYVINMWFIAFFTFGLVVYSVLYMH